MIDVALTLTGDISYTLFETMMPHYSRGVGVTALVALFLYIIILKHRLSILGDADDALSNNIRLREKFLSRATPHRRLISCSRFIGLTLRKLDSGLPCFVTASINTIICHSFI